jgi:hypothetical protein
MFWGVAASGREDRKCECANRLLLRTVMLFDVCAIAPVSVTATGRKSQKAVKGEGGRVKKAFRSPIVPLPANREHSYPSRPSGPLVECARCGRERCRKCLSRVGYSDAMKGHHPPSAFRKPDRALSRSPQIERHSIRLAKGFERGDRSLSRLVLFSAYRKGRIQAPDLSQLLAR